MENQDVGGMDRQAYFDMCQALGTEPIEHEIPVEFSDFSSTVQQALELYNYLSDRWEGMSGVFMGKDYGIVFELFNTFNIDHFEDRKLYLRIMNHIDNIRSEIISRKQKLKDKKSPI